MSFWHPRLFDSLVLLDPVIQIPNPSIATAMLSTRRRDVWQTRDEAESSFRRNKAFQAWDPRTLDLWIQHGLRDIPTELYPAEGSSSDNRVTLATSKHQELFNYLRPTYKPRNWETFNDVDPAQNTEYPGYLFYRPEPAQIFRRLPELRPNVQYVFGKHSGFSSPAREEEKMATTGAGIGGSGGCAAGRVRDVILDCGHLVAMEKVQESADAIAAFLGEELEEWSRKRREFQAHRAGTPRREQITIDEEWAEKVNFDPAGSAKL